MRSEEDVSVSALSSVLTVVVLRGPTDYGQLHSKRGYLVYFLSLPWVWVSLLWFLVVRQCDPDCTVLSSAFFFIWSYYLL
jgi:hypothetical protein